MTSDNRRVAMRILLWSLFVILLPGNAMARCAPFDFFESIGTIPYIVHGRVSQSNSEDLLAQKCNVAGCTHRFRVQVIQVLKGNIEPKELDFEYQYVPQRPNIALFSTGDEYIFAIDEVSSEGKATLFGTTCGRSGLGIEHIDAVRQALK